MLDHDDDDDDDDGLRFRVFGYACDSFFLLSGLDGLVQVFNYSPGLGLDFFSLSSVPDFVFF
jgi:hypothetical protein